MEVPNARKDIPPLHYACRSGDLETVRFLVEVVGVDVNHIDDHNCPPLYYAALVGDTRICAYLLESGATISQDDSARIFYVALTDELRRYLRTHNVTAKMKDPYMDAFRKLFESGRMADCSVTVGIVTLKCHKVVLAAQTDGVFEALFRGEGGGGDAFRLAAGSAGVETAELWERAIRFLYSGDVTAKNAAEAVQLASIFDRLGMGDVAGQLRECVQSCERRRPRARILDNRRLKARLGALLVAPTAASERLADMRVEANDGTVFRLHSCVLSAQSGFFQAFEGQRGHFEDGECLRIDASGRCFECAARFLYGDEVLCGPETAYELVGLAGQFMLPRLAQVAATILEGVLDADNAVQLLSFSRIHGLDKFEAACVGCVAANISGLVQQEGEGSLRELLEAEVAGTVQRGTPEVDVPLAADLLAAIAVAHGGGSHEEEAFRRWMARLTSPP